jgi:hypothetical protein
MVIKERSPGDLFLVPGLSRGGFSTFLGRCVMVPRMFFLFPVGPKNVLEDVFSMFLRHCVMVPWRFCLVPGLSQGCF